MKKHFIIAGAQRSGTTYLYEVLDEHPEICMSKPVKPEPKYFIEKEKEDLNLEQYYNYFFNHCSEKTKIFGEKSTSYYERKESAELIAHLLPGANIIFLLRNPVERAISNYFFSVNNGLEDRSIEEVFLKNTKHPKIEINNISVNPYNYFGRGEYAKLIEKYKKYFSSDMIKVVLLEEFVGNIDKIQDLYGYLDVNKKFIPKKINKRINPSEKSNKISIEVITMLKSYYKDPNQKLERLLNIDLSIWK